jgi:hypothetical protein
MQAVPYDTEIDHCQSKTQALSPESSASGCSKQQLHRVINTFFTLVGAAGASLALQQLGY